MLRSPFPAAAGRRTTEILIEKAIDAPANSTGEVLPEFRPFCRAWGGAANQFGREYTAAMATQSQTQAVYTIPYDSTTVQITTRMRARIGARILNITSAFDFEDRHEVMVLGVSELEQPKV